MSAPTTKVIVFNLRVAITPKLYVFVKVNVRAGRFIPHCLSERNVSSFGFSGISYDPIVKLVTLINCVI